MKQVKLIFKIFFAIAFLLLFLNRISDYRTAYLKFALIDFIYKNNSAVLFYLFGAIELILVFSIFFLKKKWGRFLSDAGLVLYVPFLMVYYMILLKESAGCIECNYTTHFWGEDIKVTSAVLVILIVGYLSLMRKNTGDS